MSVLWTRAEIEALQSDTEDHIPRKDTARRLGRSHMAVKDKAHTLGLTYPDETEDQREDRLLVARWRARLPAMKEAIRKAVLQSA
jgi:hypothetical protein